MSKKKKQPRKPSQSSALRKKSTPSRRSLETRLRECASSLADLKNKFTGLTRTIQTIYENQVELAKSETRLDEQFAVLTRLCIGRINEIATLTGRDELYVTYEQVNAMFEQWAEFKKRPDFRDHMQVWMMGKDLAELPEPPAVPPAEGETDEQISSVGDPADSQAGPEGAGEDAQAAVSEVQDDDSAEGEPGLEENRAAVP